MTGYDIITKIIEDLDIKLSEIYENNQFPLIFILIGTYPGCSRIHQTPPIICEYIKNDNLSPIVVTFEPTYKRNNTPLLFLNKKSKYDVSSGQTLISEIKENTWYYPDFISQLNDTYKGKVAYQYNTFAIDEQNINKILESLIKKKGLVFVWNFAGMEFPSILKLPSHKFNIPYASCIANIKFNIEYNRKIIKKSTKKYELNKEEHKDLDEKQNIDEEYELVSITETFSELMNEFQNLVTEQLNGIISVTKHSRIMFLKAVIINSIKKWVEYFSSLYLWENKVRLLDYRKKVFLNKDSSNDDWHHYKYRSNMNDEIEKLKKKFMKSEFYNFIDFLNNEIYNQTNLLITFDSYDFLDIMITCNYINKINTCFTDFSNLSFNTKKNINDNNDYINIDINKQEINNDFKAYYSKKIKIFEYTFNIDYNSNSNNNNQGELPYIISDILDKYKNIDHLL